MATKDPRTYTDADSDVCRGGVVTLSEATRDGPTLLVSVRDAAEAIEALEGGAGILDVKDPHEGPLGRASRVATHAIVRAWESRGRRSLLTAALGDLDPGESADSFEPPRGVAIFKLGLAGWSNRPGWEVLLDGWRRKLASHSANLVVAAYADWREARSPNVDAVLAFAISRGLPFFLVDTFKKDGRGLRDHVSLEQVAGWIAAAHAAHVRVALAGSLRVDDLDLLAALGADVLAARGAACRNGDRLASIDRARVATLSIQLAARRRRPA